MCLRAPRAPIVRICVDVFVFAPCVRASGGSLIQNTCASVHTLLIGCENRGSMAALSSTQTHKSPVVAAFMAPGGEECEALVVLDILHRVNIAYKRVSITPEHEVVSAHNLRMACDCSIYDDDFSFDNFDVLFLPGGIPGTPNLRACEPLCNALRVHNEQGKRIAAICAAPSILAELGILSGKRATSNPAFQHVLSENGATVEQEYVVRDGNLFTSQGLGTAMDLGLALVDELAGADAVEKAKKSIVYLH